MEIHVNAWTPEARQLLATLTRRAPQQVKGALTRAMARIKQRGVAEAKANCPISPTKAQYEASLRRGAAAAGASVKIRYSKDGRVVIGSSRLKSKRDDFDPGGLTQSIQGRSDDKMAEIYIPSNSRGAKYAFYIEEEGPHGTGKWRNRGIGTRRKGSRADDKFMTRAVMDNMETFRGYIDDELRRALLRVQQ